MKSRSATRWNVALAAAMLTSATGVLFEEPILLLSAIPPLVLAGYSHATSTPNPAIEIERSLSETDPDHGQEVDVTVTVRNPSDRTSFDVRITDGVAPMLPVVAGSARHATVLGPRRETSFSYTVVPTHGVHRFESASVVCRNASASSVVETTAPETTELSCRSPIRTLPFSRSPRHTGGSNTILGESGIEFSRIRAYRPGDPPGRIDWNRYARERELTTVTFHEDRLREVALCLDARACCYRSAGRDKPHAVFYERTIVCELLEAVAETNGRIGLGILGSDVTWLAPQSGDHHAATIRRTLADSEALPLTPPEGVRRRDENEDEDGHATILRSRLDRGTDLVYVSPLLDGESVETARTLRGAGRRITVLSPDVTATDSVGRSIARLERQNRIDALRRSDVTVVDWDPETPLETAIQRGVRK
ncbi:hypothetical protein HALLA_20960 (plasmid) [Halostagnicola larsenii XH-48]|uniref:DUF58 domain-containing protein n=1 Tax=Halostagnicola larsenii XH-48 TaxID=797299 RepID=W0JYP3_9EURY|nr:DUF58 domain-containing protein [Halostagnicola larsenii]AHG02377.1 hypothetical protein HALLA_20960 [Halostagnicola larsenii XH-48]